MPQYSMKAVCRLTGLSPDRLRAWERRYKAVTPKRSPTGRRVYQDSDLRRLSLLAQLVLQGHHIGALAALPTRELSAFRAESKAGGESHRADVEGVLKALGNFSFDDMKQRLARARFFLSPQDFAFGLVPELMREVGERIEQGRFSIAHEHALSDLVRHGLRQLYDDLSPLETRPQRVLVFAAPEGHFHDFGLLLAAIRCRSLGYATRFLGANMPAVALVEGCRGLGGTDLFLGISAVSSMEDRVPTGKYLVELDRLLPKKVPLWVGGPGAARVQRRELKRDVWLFDSLEELDQKLS